MAPELIEFSRSWRPDLIVFEPTAWAGPIAAADLGVPAIRHLYGPDLLWRGREAVTGAVETLAARLGVRGVTPFGAMTIDPCPEALQVPGADYPRLPVRYVPCSGPDVTEDPPEARFRRPRVCVTWGTTLARIHPRFFLTERIAAVLDPLDVNVLACLTPDQTPLVTAGFRATDTVSLRAAMITCDLLVAHGGAATVMTAATVGIPALLIPRLPDHDGHAARMEAAGAAIRLDAGRCDADLIRDGVRRLLADRSFRDAARRLRDDMARRPSPAALTAPLEELAAFQPTSSGTRAGGHTLTVVHRSPGR